MDGRLGNGFCSPDPRRLLFPFNVSGISVSMIRDWMQDYVLSTGLGSAPHIHMEGSVAGEIQLVCTAEGWFPEPRVHWEDSRGGKLLTLSEHHILDEDGLFHVEATLVVRNASTETVSCSIHNPVLTEEKSTVFSIPGQCSAPRTQMLRLAGEVPGTAAEHWIYF